MKKNRYRILRIERGMVEELGEKEMNSAEATFMAIHEEVVLELIE